MTRGNGQKSAGYGNFMMATDFNIEEMVPAISSSSKNIK